jgi:hypothetical protein
LATGDSQLDRTIRHLLGEGVATVGYTLERTVLIPFLVAGTSGTVKNIEVYEEMKTLPSHRDSVLGVRNGDRIVATSDLFSSLGLGFVVLAHERRDQVWTDCADLRGHRTAARDRIELAVSGEMAQPRSGKGLLLAVLLGSQGMANVDIAIVHVAIPSIERTLHTTSGQSTAVVAGYTLACALSRACAGASR